LIHYDAHYQLDDLITSFFLSDLGLNFSFLLFFLLNYLPEVSSYKFL